MPEPGHRQRHGVRKKAVAGVSGVILGAAAFLLLARLIKAKKAGAPPIAGRPTQGSATAAAAKQITPAGAAEAAQIDSSTL